MELNEKIEKRTEALQKKQIEALKKRMEFIDTELEIKTKLGFKKVNPDYEYENHPDYLEHMKNGFKLTVTEEKLKLQSMIDNILNDMDNREEIKKEREKRKEVVQ
jgi:hypothetical protein